MTLEDEKELWEDAIFVFDTSALGNLYGYNKDGLDVIVAILTYLKSRIWIPGQVKQEYEKNRERMIRNNKSLYPELSKYTSDKLFEKINDLINKKLHDDSSEGHPYFSKEKLDELKKICSQIKDKHSEIKILYDGLHNIYKDESEKRKNEIDEIVDDDKIRCLINSLNSGRVFKFNEKLDIVKEGHIRYYHAIPPGYMDDVYKCKEDSRGKSSMNKFGDLFVWKEILRYAQTTNSSIIFINDDEKEDWYKKSEPREELLEEFSDTTKHKFWMYTLREFIEKLEIYEKNELINLTNQCQLDLDSGIKNIKEILDEKSVIEREIKCSNIFYKCPYCNSFNKLDIKKLDLEYEFYLVGAGEKDLGDYRIYELNKQVICQKCRKLVVVKIKIIEYPLCDVYDGRIYINNCDVTNNNQDVLNYMYYNYILNNVEYYDNEAKFFPYYHIDEANLDDEYRRFMEKDD